MNGNIILKGKLFNSFQDLRNIFETALIKNATKLGLPENGIMLEQNKGNAPYLLIKYNPADEYDDTFAAVGIKYHAINIYAIICTNYDNDYNYMNTALQIAGKLEMLCTQIGLEYTGHESGLTDEMLSNKRQTEYYLICSLKANYKNIDLEFEPTI